MPKLSLPRRSLLHVIAIAGLASAANLQLSQVQSIVGFSTSCFNAYNTRLPDCSLADFLGSVGGRNVGCSVSCVSQLSELQPIVQASCQGERAGRDTVIGQMFLGTVTTFLCGADVGGGGLVSTSTAVTSMSTATTSMETAAPDDETTTTSQTSTTEQSTATTETSSSATTASISSTSETLDTTTASTAQPTRTADANRDGQDGTQTTFGGSGGGSPFDGGPGEFDSAASSLASHHATLMLLGGFLCMLLIR